MDYAHWLAMRAISRDTTVLAYRKRFLPTINTETGAHRSNWFRAAILCAIDRSRRVPQRATLVARFKTIKILTRYGMDAKSFSVWRVYCWWNKLEVPVCRYFFLTILLRYAVSNWEISLEYIKYIVERMWIWNTYFWFYLVIGNAFFWNEFL